MNLGLKFISIYGLNSATVDENVSFGFILRLKLIKE